MEYVLILVSILPSLSGIGNLLGWLVDPLNRQLGLEEQRLLLSGIAGPLIAFLTTREWKTGCVSRVVLAIVLSFVIYSAWGLLINEL